MAYTRKIAQGLREKVNVFLNEIRFGQIKTEPTDKEEPVVYRATFIPSDDCLKQFNDIISYCEDTEYSGYLFYPDPGYFTIFAGKFQIIGFLGTTYDAKEELVTVMKIQIVDYSLSEKVLALYHATPGFDLLELIESTLSDPFIRKVRDNIESSTIDPQPVANFVGNVPE